MAVRNTHEAAAGEVAAALSQLQLHIDQEMKRGTPAAGPGAAAVVATEVPKGKALLEALHGCARQLCRLRDTLLEQADMPREACSNVGRDAVIVEEGHKTQTALLHAQQVADDMYHESLAQLSDDSTEAACQAQVLDAVETCDRTNAETVAALSAVIAALSSLASSDSSPSAGIMGYGGGRGDGAGAGDAGRQATQEQRKAAPTSSLGKGGGAGIAASSVVAPRGAASAPAPAPAPAPPEARAGRISRDSGSGSDFVLNAGIHRSAVGRSCRSQAARLKSGEAQARRTKASSATWGPASRTATATEVAVALGLNPVTRAEVHAAAEGSERTASRAALLGGGGMGGNGADFVGSAQGSGFGGWESAEFPAGAGAPIPGNRKMSAEEQRQSKAVSSTASRIDTPSAAGAVETAAPVAREVGNRDKRGKVTANHTAAAATKTGTFRKSSRAPAAAAAATAAAAAGGGVSAYGRRPVVTSMLASPSGIRQSSNRSMRIVQGGGSRASSHTASSAGRSALAARPRLSADAGGSGRYSAAAPSTADNNNNKNPGSALDTAFRESLDEHAACAFLADADLSAFLSSGSSALGSPGRSLGTTRSSRRQDLLNQQSAASGGGARRGGGGGSVGVGAAPAASAARQMRSQSAGRSSMAPRRQSGSASRFFAAEVEAATAGGGGGGGGGGDADGGVSRHNPGMDADEAAARRFAKQEQEAQAREDELLAFRLAAREEAGAERRAARRRENVQRRNARRNTVPAHLGLDNPAVATAALAALVGGGAGAGGGGGGGGTVGVSDAVRALQFQDIDATDYETLLALDEGGGEGGRCCAGGRGLTEEAVEAVLRPEEAAGERLEESCAICMAEFELDDEISVLPCLHAFHSVCIRKWLLMRNRCPTDMQPVVPDSPTKAK